MLHLRLPSAPCAALLLGLLLAQPGQAQPTYKNDVRAHLNPKATLQLAGTRLSRTEVQDDPGFRLQYHFKKAGASVTTVEARSNPGLDIPTPEPAVYTVAL